MSKMEPLPGTSDLWAPETSAWVYLENTARKIAGLYGYSELRTPVFERTEVFVRGIGGDTEVVQKEMYTFTDRGGRSLTLRPEGTAGTMRAIASQGVAPGEEKRVFYCGPMFRGERPAAGRKRQFHQIGVEAVGKHSPVLDAENIVMLNHYLDEIGVPQRRLLLNTRGTSEERQKAAAELQDFFRPHINDMCQDCQRRLTENVWRILDCKNETCGSYVQRAPAVTELLSQTSREFFAEVCRCLDSCSVNYQIAPHLVRGLDYYEHTVFEVVSDNPNLGAQNAIAGGGRYEVTLPGSRKSISGVGFALGVERLLMAQPEKISELENPCAADVFVAVLESENLAQGLKLSCELRQAGLRVLCETEGRSMKAQMRGADKSQAPLTIIVGGSELADNQVTFKYMKESRQVRISRDQAVKSALQFFA